MARDPERLAELLGAKLVAKVPDVGGGAFGAARLARVVAELQARPERVRENGAVQSSANGISLPLSDATERKLVRLAAQASTPERKVSPMQLAAQLLEDALAGIPEA
jgi:hypothetical protein